MKSPSLVATSLIIVWFLLVLTIFVIVTVPAEGRHVNLLPNLFWKLQEAVYPLFFSPWLK